MAKEIRFAVGSKEDVRSSVWRLWAEKDDLYLGARSFVGQSKISFHPSGICRLAVVSRQPRPAIKSWKSPPETSPGVAPVLSVIVPSLVIRDRFIDRLPPPHKPMIFVPAPTIGRKVILRILLTEPHISESDLRKLPADRPIYCHGSLQLKSKTAWLLSCNDEFAPNELHYVMHMIATTKLNLRDGSKKEGINAHMHILEVGQGIPWLVDLQLGKDNL